MADPRPDPADLEPGSLPRLAGDLARLADAGIEIPRDVDDAVLGEARRVLTATRRTRGTLRRLGAWTAAAAGLALVAWVGWMFVPSPHPPRDAVVMTLQPPAEAARRGDLDGSGRIDILDAFALARLLEAGASPAGGDVNADGVVDGADIEAIAMRAVKLPQEAG